jgi:hypothetical protein
MKIETTFYTTPINSRSDGSIEESFHMVFRTWVPYQMIAWSTGPKSCQGW